MQVRICLDSVTVKPNSRTKYTWLKEKRRRGEADPGRTNGELQESAAAGRILAL
jgi:hypothetical protein